MTTSRTASKRTRIAAGLATMLAAFCVAVPAAQAELVGGVRDGGCLQGVQVGSATNSDGSVTPICRIIR